MKQIQVFTGDAGSLQKQANVWLEKHPSIVVEQMSVSSDTITGHGTFATIVILWSKKPGKSDDPIGDM